MYSFTLSFIGVDLTLNVDLDDLYRMDHTRTVCTHPESYQSVETTESLNTKEISVQGPGNFIPLNYDCGRLFTVGRSGDVDNELKEPNVVLSGGDV